MIDDMLMISKKGCNEMSGLIGVSYDMLKPNSTKFNISLLLTFVFRMIWYVTDEYHDGRNVQKQ